MSTLSALHRAWHLGNTKGPWQAESDFGGNGRGKNVWCRKDTQNGLNQTLPKCGNTMGETVGDDCSGPLDLWVTLKVQVPQRYLQSDKLPSSAERRR